MTFCHIKTSSLDITRDLALQAAAPKINKDEIQESESCPTIVNFLLQIQQIVYYVITSNVDHEFNFIASKYNQKWLSNQQMGFVVSSIVEVSMNKIVDL